MNQFHTSYHCNHDTLLTWAEMKKSTRTAGLLLLAALTINAAPSTENTLITRQTVDSCTATKFVDIASIVKKCTHITLSNIHIPRKSKIDLSKLKNGTTVTFAGTTVSLCLWPKAEGHVAYTGARRSSTMP